MKEAPTLGLTGVRIHKKNKRVWASLHNDWDTGSDETVSTVVSLATRIEAWSDALTAIFTDGTMVAVLPPAARPRMKEMSKMPARPDPTSADAVLDVLRL